AVLIDEDATADGSLNISSGALTQSFPACEEVNQIPSFSCNAIVQTNPASFVFGQPFSFSASLTNHLDTLGHGGDSHATAQLIGLTIRNATGDLVPNANIAVSPEPASFAFAAAGIAALALYRKRR